MKQFLIILLCLISLAGCFKNNKAKLITCPTYPISQDRNPCELEYWENQQFKKYLKEKK